MKKQALSLLLALLIVGSSLAACGGSSGNDKTTTKSGSDTTAPAETTAGGNSFVQDDLPELDFDGKDYIVLSVEDDSDYPKELVDKIENDIVSAAVGKRNNSVMERLGIKLDVTYAGDGNQEASAAYALKQSMAGDTSYQTLLWGQYWMAKYQHRGILANMKDVDYLDFSKPWWANKQIESVQCFGDQLFLLTSDTNYTAIGNLACVFMNKSVIGDTLSDVGADGLYELALNGGWTIDKLIEFSRIAAKDMDGNSVMDDNDRYGFVDAFNTKQLLLGMGVTLSQRDPDNDGAPYLQLSSDINLEAIDKLIALTYKNDFATIAKDITSHGLADMTIFMGDRAAFVSTILNSAARYFRDMESEYGVLPMPKLNETQTEYYSRPGLDCSTTAVNGLLSDEDLEFVGAVLEAMASASYRMVMPAYYEKAMKTKYTSDSVSGKVIDLVHNAARSEFADVYGDEVSNPIEKMQDVAKNGKNTFSSTVATVEESSQKALDKYLKKLEKIR